MGLSWKPKRKGGIYCSPACGRGCTHREYLRAVEDAEKLASKAKGFKPRVTENMGWHYSIEALGGHITIRTSRKGYSALASITHAYSGNCTWGSVNATTPQKAVNRIKANLRKEIKKLQKFLAELEELDGGSAES